MVLRVGGVGGGGVGESCVEVFEGLEFVRGDVLRHVALESGRHVGGGGHDGVGGGDGGVCKVLMLKKTLFDILVV